MNNSKKYNKKKLYIYPLYNFLGSSQTFANPNLKNGPQERDSIKKLKAKFKKRATSVVQNLFKFQKNVFD